jgi:hypothetical protein
MSPFLLRNYRAELPNRREYTAISNRPNTETQGTQAGSRLGLAFEVLRIVIELNLVFSSFSRVKAT